MKCSKKNLDCEVPKQQRDLILLSIAFVFRWVFYGRTYQYLTTNTCGTKPLVNNHADRMEVKVESQEKHTTVFSKAKPHFNFESWKYIPVNTSLYHWTTFPSTLQPHESHPLDVLLKSAAAPLKAACITV